MDFQVITEKNIMPLQLNSEKRCDCEIALLSLKTKKVKFPRNKIILVQLKGITSRVFINGTSYGETLYTFYTDDKDITDENPTNLFYVPYNHTHEINLNFKDSENNTLVLEDGTFIVKFHIRIKKKV